MIAAVEAKLGPKFAGMYAYNLHGPPPGIRVNPHVVVSVATAYLSGGFSIDQLLAGWSRQGATTGVREYFSVNTWDRDLPGRPRAARIEYLKTTIPRWHSEGARFFNSESGDNWGPCGLGYYLAARMLWDVREAARTDDIIRDFLERAFGAAKEPMADFYRLLDGSKQKPLSDDLIGRMYRALAEARRRTDDAAVVARLNDLLLYVRYVELFFDYSNADGDERQKAFETMLRHAYRIGGTEMVSTKALWLDLRARDRSVNMPDETRWNVPEPKNPWKVSRAFTQAELDGVLSDGIARHPLLDFETVSFSGKLVPATKLKLPDTPTGTMGPLFRGNWSLYTWLDGAAQTLKLTASGGWVYDNRGDAKIYLHPEANPFETIVDIEAVDRASITQDQKDMKLDFKTTYTGLHWLELSDRQSGTKLDWPEGQPVVAYTSLESATKFHGRWSLYFYVPKGTKVLGGFAKGPGTLRDANGREVHVFPDKPGFFNLPIPAGQDGKVWQFFQTSGARVLMTVPPYLARSAKELLLPEEVVERDAPR